jgi:hypothetical protein
MVAASVAALFFWLAFIFAVFGALAWVGQRIDERDERRRTR